MKDKCDCYRVKKIKQSCISQITGMPFWYDIEVSYCNGTREQDECSCGGDETKCDFYPEVRERAKVRIGEDSLIVTYDCCSPDAPTLCIARKEKDKVKVLNTIQGDEAFGIYHYLTGGANLVLGRDIPKKPKKLTYKLLLDDGWMYECPTCGCACGENKYHPEVTQDDVYCTQCGQKLDWD